MSLVLSFNICQKSDCSQFTFYETTGAYDALTNDTGWGSPNDELIDVITPVTLDITDPNNNTYSLDIATLNPSFPTDNTSLGWDIDMGYLGGVSGDPIPDGIYTFVYTVTTSNSTYTQTQYVAFYCNVRCCVFEMIKNFNAGCDCCDKDRDTIINAFLLYQGLVSAANCGNISAFNNILTQLQKICKNNKCRNCK